VLGGADTVVPVDVYIPGCPPRPEAIIYGAALALGIVPKKIEPQKQQHLPPGFDLESYLEKERVRVTA
jgi:Ni,Fe-hydrogenase III small subunit